jgi:hypothetical protein
MPGKSRLPRDSDVEALCASLEAAPEAPNALELEAQLDAEFARVREELNRLLPLKSA